MKRQDSVLFIIYVLGSITEIYSNILKQALSMADCQQMIIIKIYKKKFKLKKSLLKKEKACFYFPFFLYCINGKSIVKALKRETSNSSNV